MRTEEQLVEYRKAYYQANRKKVDERAKRYWDNNPARYLVHVASKRAKKYNIEFSITTDDVFIPDVCPILKVPFEKRTMHAMSLDRKDPTKGYVPGNVQVISRKANSMKSNATPEELRQFAQWVIFNVENSPSNS